MQPNLNQHYFLTSSPEIDSIVKPLKDYFGLTSFVYHKNFHDGSEIRLTNQPEWVKYFYQNELYAKSIFEHVPEQYSKTRVLWSSLAQHRPILSKARAFNIDHGITFIEPQSDGCEFFFLGTTPQHPEVVPHYLSNLDLLERFLAYFKETAAPIIKHANHNRLVIPNKLNTNPLTLPAPQIDRTAFLNALNMNTLQKFSPREIDCIKLLLRGYTAKMIANELAVSTRTIETHLEHIKLKAGCHTKAELIKFLYSKQKVSVDFPDIGFHAY